MSVTKRVKNEIIKIRFSAATSSGSGAGRRTNFRADASVLLEIAFPQSAFSC